MNFGRAQFYSGLGADIDGEWDVVLVTLSLILSSPRDSSRCACIGYVSRGSERRALESKCKSILLCWFVVFKRGVEERVVRTSKLEVVPLAKTVAEDFLPASLPSAV